MTLSHVVPLAPKAAVIPAIDRRPLPGPSSLEGVLGAHLYPASPPAPALRFVIWLRRKLQALADLLVPAQIAIFEHSFGMIWTASLGAIARYGVADVLAAGPLTSAEIAQKTGTNPDAMHRLLRGMATLGLFVLRDDGRFENNRLSRSMMAGTLARSKEWLLYFASQSNYTAWGDLDRTLATGENAFERVFGMSVWEWFETYPDEREMFAQGMMGLTVMDAPVVASLYPFGEIKTVCDVGGGRGTLLSEVLLRHPSLRGILCDVPGVLESAKPLFAARGVSDRVDLRSGSFFESVPSGADAYMLKNILHDWDDERCRLILGNVRRAMTPGQRVLLVEMLVPKNEATGMGPLVDLQMMVVCSGGRERSLEELNTLLTETGFAPARVFPYPTVAVTEGRAV